MDHAGNDLTVIMQGMILHGSSRELSDRGHAGNDLLEVMQAYYLTCRDTI
jgi:hypothetical protein